MLRLLNELKKKKKHMSTATVIKDKKKITILANQTKTPSSESSVPNETAGGENACCSPATPEGDLR